MVYFIKGVMSCLFVVCLIFSRRAGGGGGGGAVECFQFF